MKDFSLAEVKFRVDVAGAPWDGVDQFVHEFKGVIVGNSDWSDDDYTVGTIQLIKISTTEAINQQFSLFDVFDSHSAFLLSVFGALFDCENEDVKEDLDIDAFWHDLLVIADIKIRREYRKTLAAVHAINSAISFFGSTSIIVAPRKNGDYRGLQLTTQEWRKLGFVNLAGYPFAIREQTKQNPYCDSKTTEG